MLTGSQQETLNKETRFVEKWDIRWTSKSVRQAAYYLSTTEQEIINYLAQLPGHGYVGQLGKGTRYPIDRLVRGIEIKLNMKEFELEDLEKVEYNTICNLYNKLYQNS